MRPSWQVKPRFLLLSAMLVLAFVALGCNRAAPLQVSRISMSPEENQLTAGQVASLTLEASGTNLNFKWSANRGEISGQGASVLYTAPDEPGPDVVTVEVESAGGSMVRSLSIQIVPPPVTPTPVPTDTPSPPPTNTPVPTDTLAPMPTHTPAPTDTPVPPATDTPAPAPTPTPAPTDTPTATPMPAVSVANVQPGDVVCQSLPLEGLYAPQVSDDIWVFVGLPQGTTWPQSPDACAGAKTSKERGRWQVQVGVGADADTGKTFEIMVTTADPAASRFLADLMQQWCRDKDYPGIPRDGLPDGLTVHQQFNVIRGEIDAEEPRPNISGVQLPGRASIEGIAEGEVLPRSLTVRGTTTAEVVDHVWVLVRAPGGRYYPQSTRPCEGVHALQGDGRWETSVNLGGDGDVGQPFDIILALADDAAHTELAQRQEDNCAAGFFPGWQFVELPPGLDQQASLRVTHQ